MSIVKFSNLLLPPKAMTCPICGGSFINTSVRSLSEYVFASRVFNLSFCVIYSVSIFWMSISALLRSFSKMSIFWLAIVWRSWISVISEVDPRSTQFPIVHTKLPELVVSPIPPASSEIIHLFPSNFNILPAAIPVISTSTRLEFKVRGKLLFSS